MFKNWIWKLAQRFCQKELDALTIKAINNQKKTFIEQSNLIKAIELNQLFDEPVIVISNEWEDPVIGFGVRIEYITQSNQPVLVVKDYITEKEVLCMGKIFTYTEQRFKALCKLDPFERCSLFFAYHYNDTAIDKPKHSDILTEEQIIDRLTQNGFYTRLKE